MKRYVKHITVGAADLDALQHVNNVRYLDWVQEISREHWSELTRPEWEARYFWVVRSHHIEYLRAAVAGDHLTLTTYVPKVSGPLSHRVVEICQAGLQISTTRRERGPVTSGTKVVRVRRSPATAARRYSIWWLRTTQK